jgi:hypothetical protein
MAELNPEYLLEQFQLIEEYLRRARGIAGRSREDYLGDPYAVDASIRELIVLFETSHNVAKHLISREGWRVPASKAEAFEVLGEQGILPTDLVDALNGFSRLLPNGLGAVPAHRRVGLDYMCDSLSSSKITHLPVASGPTSMAMGLEYFLSAR